MPFDFEHFYDISVTLGSEAIDYPGDPPYARDLVSSLTKGDDYDLSVISTSLHCGTHIDAPAHFITGGKTIDQFSVYDFIRPALVVQVPHRGAIIPIDLENLVINPGDALLFRTDNSTQDRPTNPVFSESYVYVSAEAARYCVTKGVGLVGIDYVSVDRFGDEDYPAHRTLLGNNILILEGIDLKNVPPGRYVLHCLPLKIWSAEASPVRAVLFS